MRVFVEKRKWAFRLIEKCVPFLLDAALAAKAFVRDRREIRGAEKLMDSLLLQSPFPPFSYIEIETINRCNNDCPFCPVNRNEDPRPRTVMGAGLFRSIVQQLQAVDYSGIICLYSNNEPLLDPRIIEFHKYAREKLPNAFLCLYTNGILLNEGTFLELMRFLDRLRINNYDDELRLIPSVNRIWERFHQDHAYQGKVDIFVQQKHVMRLNRGGISANRSRLLTCRSPCLLPFVQLVVRPDGKVSLCCQDGRGRVTLGDLTLTNVLDVWNGADFWQIRERMRQGRNSLEPCKFCDVFPDLAVYRRDWETFCS